MKPRRHLYGLKGRGGGWRTSLRVPALPCRTVSAADADSLGALMHAAYLGTIDDEGETLEQARIDMRGFFAGRWGAPIPPACLAIEREGRFIATALICDWNEPEAIVAGPLVAFVLVHPDARGQGLGIAVVNAALTQLAAARRGRVYAVITAGNTPSETLFRKLGFTVLD